MLVDTKKSTNIFIFVIIFIGGEIMGRPKGGKNREWTIDMKLQVINFYFEGHSVIETMHQFDITSKKFFYKIINDYNNGGIEALKSKRKPGNPLSKYSNRKELTEIEQLEYENMILRIENERLKKGYTQEDVILAKEKLLEKNTK